MKIVLCTPSYGLVDPIYERACCGMESGGIERVGIRDNSDQWIARTLTDNAALIVKADLLVHVDSDTHFTIEQAEELTQAAEHYPYIGGLYAQPGDRVTVKFDKPTIIGHEPVEAKHLGLGFTAIRRDVFEAVEKLGVIPRADNLGGPCWFWPAIVDGAALPTDFSFSHWATLAGYKPWVHGGIRVRHAKYSPIDVPAGPLKVDESGCFNRQV